jgi:hypothetical protein
MRPVADDWRGRSRALSEFGMSVGTFDASLHARRVREGWEVGCARPVKCRQAHGIDRVLDGRGKTPGPSSRPRHHHSTDAYPPFRGFLFCQRKKRRVHIKARLLNYPTGRESTLKLQVRVRHLPRRLRCDPECRPPDRPCVQRRRDKGQRLTRWNCVEQCLTTKQPRFPRLTILSYRIRLPKPAFLVTNPFSAI